MQDPKVVISKIIITFNWNEWQAKRSRIVWERNRGVEKLFGGGSLSK